MNFGGEYVSKRIKWIDMVKGVGMLLVMFAHAPLPEPIIKYIYAFHMPLFFFISGYLLNMSKYDSFKKFFKSKFKSLLIPYFIFSTTNYLFGAIVFNEFAGKSLNVALQPLLGMFVGIRGTNWTLCNGTLWFVLALFMAEMVFYFTVKLFKDNNKDIAISIIIFAVILYVYNMFVGESLLWSIDASIIAIVFLELGYLTRKVKLINKISKPSILIVLLITNLIAGSINTNIDISNGKYGNFFLFYIAAISGIFTMIIIIKNLPNSKFISFIGKNSFVYLAIHQYVIFGFLRRNMSKAVFESQFILDKLMVSFYFVIIACIVVYPIVKIINRWFPFILGRKKKNKRNNFDFILE